MREYYNKVKNHATYSFKEIITIFVYGIIIGFIFSFDKWGFDEFDVSTGLFYLFYFIIISLLILFGMTFVQKLIGAYLGVNPTVKFSLTTIIIPLVALLFTGGSIPFFILPGIQTKEDLSQMLGRNRYRRGFVDYLQIGSAATIVLVIFGLLFSTVWFESIFPYVGATFFFFALYGLIPFDLFIKPFDKTIGVGNGCAIFYSSRSIYVFVILLLLFAFLLAQTTLFFISLLLAVVLAFIFALLYFLYEDKIFK